MRNRRSAAVIAAAALSLAIGGCTDVDEGVPERTADERLRRSGRPGEAARFAVTGGIHELFDLVGEEVIVSGRITEELSSRAFLLLSDVLGPTPLPVIVAEAVSMPAEEMVRVVGTVRDLDDVRALLQEQVASQIAEERVVVAEEIRSVAEVEAEGDAAEEATTPAGGEDE